MDTKQIEKSIEIHNPVAHINEKEFDNALLKFGSYLSILRNKRLNQTAVLLSVLENSQLRAILHEITEIDTLQDLLREFLSRYPALCKSKVLKKKIQKIVNDSTRTKLL